jgi:DNA-binding helix-hairpin-helix protein with protein kinase domain
MTLRARRSGDTITLDGQGDAGGQGTFYRVKGRPDLGAKVLDHPPGDLADRLDVMIANPPPGLLDLSAPASCAWPLDALIGADGRGACVGLLVPFVPNRGALAGLVNPAHRGPGVTPAGLVRAFRNTARAVALLHAHGVVVGDLSARNVLADEAGNVTLIDADSVQFPAGTRVFEAPVGTADCTPPEGQGVPRAGAVLRPSYDLFGLGVLGFMAVMDGVHPFGGIPTGPGGPVPPPEQIRRGWWMYGPRVPVRPPRYAPAFDALPLEVRDLFRQCFGDGHAEPIRRPAAQSWVDALDAWLAAGVTLPAAVAVTPPAAPAGAPPALTLRVPEWVKRVGGWVRRHPRRTAATVLAAGLTVGGGWWATRAPAEPEKKPRPYLGGRPTPELWKRLGDQPR